MKAPWVAALILVLTAVFFFTCQSQDWRKADETKKWPTVTGVVLEAWTSGTPGRTSGRTKHCRYGYTVQERQYTSEQIAINYDTTIYDYVKGSKIPVHYNPGNPNDAVLETNLVMNRTGGWALTSLTLAAFFFLVGFASDYSKK